MDQSKNLRRSFLKMTFMSIGGSLIALPVLSRSLTNKPMQSKEPIKPEMVKEFVISGHKNLDKVKLLLEQEANLVNATWDWGGGDYETAIGGAGHMGRADIAEFLLSKGARVDIFCAAMLGRLDFIKPVLEAYPLLKTSKGPHGLTLLHHARQGGEKAKEVLDYLTVIGAS
jgi:hypothetical protein